MKELQKTAIMGTAHTHTHFGMYELMNELTREIALHVS